jgi:hypothetical protein
MLIVGFITGILLFIIGGALDKAERAKQDREWEEVLRRRRASR